MNEESKKALQALQIIQDYCNDKDGTKHNYMCKDCQLKEIIRCGLNVYDRDDMCFTPDVWTIPKIT